MNKIVDIQISVYLYSLVTYNFSNEQLKFEVITSST